MPQWESVLRKCERARLVHTTEAVVRAWMRVGRHGAEGLVAGHRRLALRMPQPCVGRCRAR